MKKYILVFILISLFSLPILVLAEDISTDNWIYLSVPLPGAEGGKVQNIAQYINLAYRFGIYLLATVCVLSMLIAGILYITSRGSSGIQTAKNMMKGTAIGLILGLFSFLILNTINPELTNLTVPGIETISKQTFIPTDSSGLNTGCKVTLGKNTFGIPCACGDGGLIVKADEYCCPSADGKTFEVKTEQCSYGACPIGKNPYSDACKCGITLIAKVNEYCCLKEDGITYEVKTSECTFSCTGITDCAGYSNKGKQACLSNVCNLKQPNGKDLMCAPSFTNENICEQWKCQQSSNCSSTEFCNKQGDCENKRDLGQPCDGPEVELNNNDNLVCISGNCATWDNVCIEN